jgi:hypothetical protein
MEKLKASEPDALRAMRGAKRGASKVFWTHFETWTSQPPTRWRTATPTPFGAHSKQRSLEITELGLVVMGWVSATHVEQSQSLVVYLTSPRVPYLAPQRG